MEDCCYCLSLKKQLEDLKQKHLLDFRTIKQKIISTDTLIRSYQEKCQEYDKQKKCVVELTTKLDGAQRSVEVIKLQLKKSLELKRPLQKKFDELEREKVLQHGKIQHLQDRLRGSENLVGQLQSVIKEREISTNSMRLDVTLHTEEIDEYKRSQRKNESQISKLSEQVLTEKKANKALNRELSKSQNQVKTLLDETEKSKKLIAELQRQLNTGKNYVCEQQKDTSLEKQLETMKADAEDYQRMIKELKEELWKAKQRNANENKIPMEDKIKSPTTPRQSTRTRESVTPKREEALAIIEERRPFTRLQQKHLVEEIEKKTLAGGNQSSHQENLISEIDVEHTEMLMDKVNEMLDIPYCPSLSPLPPSPFFDNSNDGCNSVGFGNNDHDYICGDDNDIDDDNHKDQNDIGDKDDSINVDCNRHHLDNVDENISNDDYDNNAGQTEDKIIPQTKDLEQSRSRKRELTAPEFGGTLMTLRSRKKRRSGNSGIDFGMFLRETDKVELSKATAFTERTLRRSKSENLKQELSTPEVNVPVTRSKSLEETTEGVLVVKQRRRRKRRLSSNDGEQTLESSDTSTTENNVLQTSKQSSGKSEEEGKTRENYILKETSKRPMSMDDFCKQDMVRESTENREENSSSAEVSTTENKTNSETLIQDQISSTEIPERRRTRSMDELCKEDIVTDIECITYTQTPQMAQNTSMNEFSKQEVVAEGEESRDEKCSCANIAPTENETESKILIHNQKPSTETPERPQISELSEQEFVTETEENKNEISSRIEVPSTEDQDDVETFNQVNNSLMEIMKRLQTMDESSNQNVFTQEGGSREDKCSEADGPGAESQTDNDALVRDHGSLDINCSKSNSSICEENLSPPVESDEALNCLQDIIQIVANESSETYLGGRKSNANVSKDDTESYTDNQDIHCQNKLMDCNTIADSVDNYSKSCNLQEEVNRTKPLNATSCNSQVVQEKSEGDLNGNHVRSSKYQDEIEDMGSKNINVAGTTDLKRMEKREVHNLDSSASLKILDRTSTENKLGTRKVHENIEVHESRYESCSNTIDPNGESKTVKMKQKILYSKHDTDKEVTQVNTESSGKVNVSRTRKRSGNSSGIVSTGKGKGNIIDKCTNDVDKSSFDEIELLRPTEAIGNTRKRRNETSKGLGSTCHSKEDNEKSTTQTEIINSDEPNTLNGSSTSPHQYSIHYLEEQVSTPLSPIPDTPKRRGRSAEIPCFDSLDHIFPLSPIPPSPPRSPRVDQVENTEVEYQLPTPSNLTFYEILAQSNKEAQVNKKRKVNKNELPKDSLHRYPGVNEPQYIVFIFTKLKNKEITLEELITALSVRKNVRNHTPICNGLITVLKGTQDDVEHALMERCAEQYELGSEGTWEPIVSQFEMQVLVAVNRLCNIQRHSSLLTKLVKWLGMNLCRLFNSGKNDAGLLAMCRIYTGVCRLMGEGSFVRVLCYDILKQNKRHSMTERIIVAIALVWSDVLGKGNHSLTIHPEAVNISGPLYCPFLATLQIILMSREMSSEQWFQRLCGWCNIRRNGNVLEWLARDLVRVLRDTSDATSEENTDAIIAGLAFETFKCLELLAIIMGWKWTNDVLIREILWPVFKEWKIDNQKSEEVLKSKESQKAGSINTAGGQSCSAPNPNDCQSQIINMVHLQGVNKDTVVATPNEKLCSVNMNEELNSTMSKYTTIDTKTKSNLKSDENNHKRSMDTTIANILRLLGCLGCEKLQKGEIINLEAVINLMCAILISPDWEKVSFSVQFAAAAALLEIVIADPLKITEVLEEWCDRKNKIDDKLTAQFARRVKEVRTHMWTVQ